MVAIANYATFRIYFFPTATVYHEHIPDGDYAAKNGRLNKYLAGEVNMKQMTLLSRHEIWNSIRGRARYLRVTEARWERKNNNPASQAVVLYYYPPQRMKYHLSKVVWIKHKQLCTLQAFEQFEALYMHSPNDPAGIRTQYLWISSHNRYMKYSHKGYF